MGIYLNQGNEGFQIVLNSKLYIDKSMLIDFTNSVINTEQRFICVSRPRRFGKTITAEMIGAYYDYSADSHSQFDNLSISKTENYLKHLNQYDVIHITLTEFVKRNDKNINDVLQKIIKNIISDIEDEYPDIILRDNEDIILTMKQVYAKTKRKFVIIIDEWDCIFRIFPKNKDFQTQYLDFLRDWMKNQKFIALSYMTGILPIKKYGEHSALNMFNEYSMIDARELCEFTGITDQEVKVLCQQYNMDYNAMKTWYDGYILQPRDENKAVSLDKRFEIYNPLSIVNAVSSKCITNYWNRTETYEALKKYIMLNVGGLKDIIIELLAGGRKKINPFKFVNDMTTFNSTDDILTLLVHLGYLGFDNGSLEVFIPNNEVREEFFNSIDDEEDWEVIVNAIKKSDDLLTATINKEADFVAEALEKAHFETSILQYNNENALSCVISLAYYSARGKYIIIREMPTGKGFADMVFIPRSNYQELPAMLVELKCNKSAKTAINQIKENQYLECLKNYKGKILLVGINYSKDINGENSKKHSCIIEEAMINE